MNPIKNKFYIITILFTTLSIWFCKAQKIENYIKGELEIRVVPFGYDNLTENLIKVGYISTEGTIHFKWPEINHEDYKGSGFFMHKLDFLLGMYNCNEETIKEKNEEIKAAHSKFFLLYNEYGDQVGSLYPATHKEIDNSDRFLTIGSFFTWFYSNGDGKLNGVCTSYNRVKDSNEFNKNSIYHIKDYDINFKKGWNIVEHKLLETEEVNNGDQKYDRRYKEQKKSISKIPNTVNWYLKYTADDQLLALERQLATQVPITKKQYEKWVPKKLGKLKRTGYEIGKKLKRMPTLNNINILFEKGIKKIDITIVDCAKNKDAISMYTLILDMASRDWKDDKETGYESASKMDNKRVITDYNEKKAKTTLSYNANERFLIKAEATNMKPKELWKNLKKLKIEKLIK